MPSLRRCLTQGGDDIVDGLFDGLAIIAFGHDANDGFGAGYEEGRISQKNQADVQAISRAQFEEEEREVMRFIEAAIDWSDLGPTPSYKV